MISCENGNLKLMGSIVEVTSDVIVAFNGIVDVLPDNKESDGYSETVIKSMFYAMARIVKNKGIDVCFSEEEVLKCDKDWENAHKWGKKND